MSDQSNEIQTNQGLPSLQNEINALKRKMARLQKEHDNLTQLYKQATALRDYNEREKEIQMRYNQMLRDNSPDDILLMDMDFNILLCTSSVKTRTGRDVTGESLIPITESLFGSDYARRLETAAIDVIQTGMVRELEILTVEESNDTHEEREIFLSVRVSPAFDGKGEINGIIVLAHDNTEMHNANLLAQTATQAKSNFLSNMSHEIRTPLNAIVGMTAIGKSANDSERKDYCLTKIEDASKHLLGVINDILDMSKIEAGKLELSETEFNFEKMLQQVVNVVNFRVDEKHQIFNVNIDRAIPRIMNGDDQRLAQVITNLLSNAVKFTPDGGTINLKTRLLNTENDICTIHIEVTDTGIGISAEQQARLFSSFQQAESNTARKFGGTGLGLAISKSIVEMMGGKIWIESELGKGATFGFTVKIKKGAEKKQEHPLSGVNWNDVRILTVDDDPDVLSYMDEILQGLGVNSDTVINGEGALRLVELNGDYNICFVDWKMPGMDGIELTRKLKAKASENSNIVVIMISSAEWNEVESEAKKAGVDEFLSKPLFPSAIADIITEQLGVSKRHKDKEQEETVDFTGYRILLVEDVEINREIVLALLEPTHLEIDCAVNGREAVRMFSESPDKYKMIFMDIQMPEMDGYTAARNIRAINNERAKDIPIIAMTANVFKEDIDKCFEAGMNAHIGKPLDFDEVLKVLSTYLTEKVSSSEMI